MSSQQQRILEEVAEYIRSVHCDGFDVRTAKHVRLLAECDEPTIAVVPTRISWGRKAKGRVATDHEIDVVFIARSEAVADDETIDTLDKLARAFLGEEPPINWECLGAVTIDEADAGFDPEELTSSPANFYGGIRLTFRG